MIPPMLMQLEAAIPSYEAEIAAAVEDVKATWVVPPALVKAIIRRESAGQPLARSAAGAIGLMQVMPETAAKVGVDVARLTEPAPNILAGVRLLAVLLKFYKGDLISVLTAYNSGAKSPGAALPANGETPEYVAAVLRYFHEYQRGTSAPSR